MNISVLRVSFPRKLFQRDCYRLINYRARNDAQSNRLIIAIERPKYPHFLYVWMYTQHLAGFLVIFVGEMQHAVFLKQTILVYERFPRGGPRVYPSNCKWVRCVDIKPVATLGDHSKSFPS